MATSRAGSTNSTGLTLMTMALGKGRGTWRLTALAVGRVPHFVSQDTLILPGVVAHMFNLNTKDTEAGGAL